MNKEIMIDLETLGTKVGSVILSIGAVEFDLKTGELGKEFYQAIDIDSCIASGLKIDAGALKFWLGQPQEARDTILNAKTTSLSEALYLFRSWLQGIGTAETYLWGNSARFDLGALDFAYQAVGREFPWYFRNEMDVRTLVRFRPEIKAGMAFEGIQHDPIADCKFQIKYCVETYKQLNHA